MKSPLRAHIALIGMVLIWGVNFSVAKMALATVPPLAFNALRFPLAALLLVLVLRARGNLRLPPRADVPRVLLVGLLGNVLYQMFFIFGLDNTSAGNASLLLAGTPLVTTLLSASVGDERVRPRTWLGVSCTFAGIVLIVLGGAHEAGTRATVLGDLLMLGAVVTWACYTVGSRPLVQRHGAVAVTAWTLWIGTAGIVVCGAHAVSQLNWDTIRPATWAAIAYAGILSIGLSYIIWYYGVSKLGNTRTSAYSNLTPAVALAGAWLWLGEMPHVVQLAGAAVIIGGVSIAQSGPLASTPAVSPEV